MLIIRYQFWGVMQSHQFCSGQGVTARVIQHHLSMLGVADAENFSDQPMGLLCIAVLQEMDRGSCRESPAFQGTWQYNDSVAEETVIAAVHAGFVHIDTAYDYHNQA